MQLTKSLVLLLSTFVMFAAAMRREPLPRNYRERNLEHILDQRPEERVLTQLKLRPHTQLRRSGKQHYRKLLSALECYHCQKYGRTSLSSHHNCVRFMHNRTRRIDGSVSYIIPGPVGDRIILVLITLVRRALPRPNVQSDSNLRLEPSIRMTNVTLALLKTVNLDSVDIKSLSYDIISIWNDPKTLG
ncbi:hypothetical protein PIIN_08722 [Serendipita indica DSM 11827]|uniref:Uncharacterized protein n=1 Tax=Serendipita indica (strain DSM 11827) TaxID=1109443 RepID=G4TTX1_SERID|nr:hypothetical protein PIIN_08722 [Serendipita indica DSM 11827]